MKIQLSDHFTYKKLLRFTLPSIAMMLFTSIYGVVDGFFVSNFAGKTAFAAVNLIMPFLMIVGAVGFMFGTGGCALVARTLGEGQSDKANRQFSLLVYTTIAIGIVFAALGIIFIRPVALILGADEEMADICVNYGRIVLLALPAFMLQYAFQAFFPLAQKPGLGLWVTVFAGVANMVLDALFVAVFNWGYVGAAAATAISQAIGGFVPLLYFARKNTSLLRLGATSIDFKSLLQAASNGCSELLSSISFSLVSILYNLQLMAHAGEEGVAAYGVLMYVSMVFQAIFIGYSMGTSPVVGYNFGANNKEELKSVFKKSLIIIGISSAIMFLLSELLAYPLTVLFVGYDTKLLEITLEAFIIFSFSFLFFGFGIYSSSFFTALSNGPVSAVISFLRTVVFQVAAVIVMPLLLGLTGIWYSIVVTEVLALIVAFIFVIALRKRYGYL